ncbi:uncharacterized protein PAE49_006180 isoform 2-T2 [Odontesthes bonariensis]|uniref:uncharacterized protein LOC142381912 isoform X2 n=1 Tax=Odontesthes bonariensis TaxID=219752 RepID=UPI003F58190B
MSPTHQMKTSENRTDDKSVMEVVMNKGKNPAQQSPLPLENMEHEWHERALLIKACNSLTAAVGKRTEKLKESMRVLNSLPTTFKVDDTLERQTREAENKREKMKMKIIAAEKIHTSYMSLYEHLKQQLQAQEKMLDQKADAVIRGQVKLEKTKKKLKSESADVERTGARPRHRKTRMEQEVREKIREMDSKLHELTAEKEELQKAIQMSGQSSRKEQVQETEEVAATESAQCGASADDQQESFESDMKLMEDVDALREAQKFAKVQQDIQKKLLVEKVDIEEVIREKTKILADLEVCYIELKCSENPAPTRLQQLKEEKLAQVKQEADRVQRLKSELNHSQDLLDTIDQGIRNLYFMMSSGPVEELSSMSSTDKLEEIRVLLRRLQQSAKTKKPHVSSEGRERVYMLMEKINSSEVKNNRRPATPPDPLESSEGEEPACPTREEIKRDSMQLIEIQKKKTAKGRKKTK